MEILDLDFIEHELQQNWSFLRHSERVMAVIFAMWDNVSGPKTDLVWRIDKMNDSLVESFSRFSLSGQMVSYDDDSVERKHHLHMLDEFFTSSIVFKHVYDGQLTQFAFSFIFDRQFLEQYIVVKNSLLNYMTYLIDLYLAIADVRREKDIGNFIKYLGEEIETIVQNANNLLRFELLNLRFHWTQYGLDVSGYNKQMLKVAITSHLQTGSTVIIGKDPNIITCWLHTISPFVFGKYKSLMKGSIGNFYTPSLSLQGIISYDIDNRDLLSSRYPTTIIDVTNPSNISIKKTENYGDFNITRNKYRQLLIEKCLDDTIETDMGDLLIIPEASPVVSSIVERIFLMKKEYRSSYIIHQFQALIQRSILLMNALELCENEVQPLQQLMKLFGIEFSGFNILMGIAEKISPGLQEKWHNTISLSSRLVEQIYL